MSKKSIPSRFDFRATVRYDADAKSRFHRAARRHLRLLANALELAPGTFDLRSNLGGIAVSGEITLHADDVYVQVSQSCMGSDAGILYRTCRDRQDYVGGPNHFASLDCLHDPANLAQRVTAIRRRAGPAA